MPAAQAREDGDLPALDPGAFDRLQREVLATRGPGGKVPPESRNACQRCKLVVSLAHVQRAPRICQTHPWAFSSL